MSRYSNYWDNKKQAEKEKRRIHPVWAGIGFLLMIIIPVVSWAGTQLLIIENAKRRWVSYTPDVLAPGSDPLLYVRIFMTVFISLVLFVLFYLAYFIIYKIFGPSRYGPLDVPQGNHHFKRYKR